MKYVLLTHVPTYAGQSPGTIRLTEDFSKELLAEAASLRLSGFDVTLATPRFGAPDAKVLSRERIVELKPSEHGLIDAPLPSYASMRQFLRARPKLEKAITALAAGAHVVQLGAGGHPTALGQFAWPLIDPLKTKRVFVFSGDPMPSRRRAIVSGRNPAKRLAKALAVRSFEAFLREAIRDADLVFAHDPAVARRFSREWSDRCHTFDVPPISDTQLAGPVVIAHRHRRLLDLDRPLRVLTSGDAGATAGLDHALRAAARARRLGARLVVELLRPARPVDLAAMQSEYGLGECVRTADENTQDAFDAADIYVSAALVLGENRTIFTAAARGLPMLSYRSNAADAALADAGGAIGIDRGENDALAEALLALCRDRQRVAAMAESARGWAAGMTRDGVHRTRAALVRAAALA